MHMLAARAGGYVDDGGQGVVRIAQTPGDIVVLSAADTTLALLAQAVDALPADFPAVRLANLMWLRQPASVDLYLDEVVQHARVVVVDHLGAAADWAYLVEQLAALAHRRGQWLAIFSGDAVEDEALLRRGTAPVAAAQRLWQYLRAGGPDNAQRFFALIHDAVWMGGVAPPPPAQAMPPAWLIEPRGTLPVSAPDAPVALLIFYRSHALAGNTAAFESLLQALARRGLRPLACAVDSLKSPSTLSWVQALARARGVSIVLNTTAFAVGQDSDDAGRLAGDAPVLQLLTPTVTQAQWQESPRGLGARDMAMQVVLPEVDGRIQALPMCFKASAWRCERAQIDVARYEPYERGIEWVAELAWRWCQLRGTPLAQQRLALILPSYPGDDSRIGQTVGLDGPAAVVTILHALHAQGYTVDGLVADGDALMAALLAGVTHDQAANAARPTWQSLALSDYLRHFAQLPLPRQQQVLQRWGPPQRDPMLRQGRFMIPGRRFGHVFVGVQPPRTHGLDPKATYHDAEIVPTHAYLAFYFWVRHHWQAMAIVHVGKHGNLEWLPGKSVAMSPDCWPLLALGPLPHLYPFLVNDPGEGAQAKRRAHAVIIDHLMPPLARAHSHGAAAQLEHLLDEYYDATLLDPRRAQRLRQRIVEEACRAGLHRDLGFADPLDEPAREQLLQRLDAYLCELKESQIRLGLHCFGHSPSGAARAQTLLALVRQPRGAAAHEDSLLRALAADLGLHGYDPLDEHWTAPWRGPRPAVLQEILPGAWRHHGHTRARLEALALALIEGRIAPAADWTRSAVILAHVARDIAPRLDASGAQELTQLLAGLQGRFVPPGPSGAPSRGRIDVLPTGRNFYSVDARALPTATAYASACEAVQRLLEQHLQAHGCYPQTVAMTLWGTSTMRTGGEEFAQALAWLGVRPRWSPDSARVIDVEVLPAAVLGRPRVDVVLRVSGFFRDAFGHLIELFDTAVQAVAAIAAEDEPDACNPVRVRVQREQAAAEAAGVPAAQAAQRARWRVFGPRPGRYGAGIEDLLTHGQWRDEADLAQGYLRSSAYAYARGVYGQAADAELAQRLAQVQVVVQTQDNQEHDILDANEYHQFIGGMAAAVRQLSERAPELVHADLSTLGRARLRPLAQEIARVVRARALNPQWLEAIRAHGYRGGSELAATIEHLFGYAATTRAVPAPLFAALTERYLLDPEQRDFLQQHNPQAMQRMAERLLEAVARGLWPEGRHFVPVLQSLVQQLEDSLETASPGGLPRSPA